MTGGMGGSHAVANGVARGRNVAFWADISAAMELVMAHSVAMETGGPVVYMGVQKGFVVLGEGQVWVVRGTR